MLGFADTIGKGSDWFGLPVTKPGHGQPEPLKPVHTYDKQENIDICTECTVPNCRPMSLSCPLCKREKSRVRAEKIAERDARTRDLINAGWVSAEAICEELHISKTTFYHSRKRLRERGEIEGG